MASAMPRKGDNKKQNPRRKISFVNGHRKLHALNLKMTCDHFLLSDLKPKLQRRIKYNREKTAVLLRAMRFFNECK